jgi:hypothetical protein
MNAMLKLKISRAALSALKNELSVDGIVKLLPAMLKLKMRGEPFASLSAPESKKDKESRALIADAVLLYRALLKYKPQPDAERITRAVITDAAIAQLKYLIPSIDKKTIETLNEEQKRQMFCDIIAKFPNAEYEIVKAEGKEYHYDITRCRLAELITAVGHPELRDAFCAGDGLYFARCQPAISFARESTIGEGHPTCPFRFTVK